MKVRCQKKIIKFSFIKFRKVLNTYSWRLQHKTAELRQHFPSFQLEFEYVKKIFIRMEFVENRSNLVLVYIECIKSCKKMHQKIRENKSEIEALASLRSFFFTFYKRQKILFRKPSIHVQMINRTKKCVKKCKR